MVTKDTPSVVGTVQVPSLHLAVCTSRGSSTAIDVGWAEEPGKDQEACRRS